MMDVKEKNVLVVGLGESGLSALRLLAAKGATLSATDMRNEEEMTSVKERLSDLEINYYLGSHPEDVFTGADLIVLSPGVPKKIGPIKKALAEGVPVVSEVELAWRYLNIPVLAITGSNGKSTTTALTAHLLRESDIAAAECGNIGKPISDFAINYEGNEVLVAELSSFQLESMDEFRPQIATVLNVTPDHLDRYADFEAYKQAKFEIFSAQTGEDFALINLNDEYCSEIARITLARKLFFGSYRPGLNGCFLKMDTIVSVIDGQESYIMDVEDLSLPGPHNISNSLAAAAMALNAGATVDGVAKGLKNFKALEHRLEPVATINGIKFVNDSKATNIDSAAVALQSFDGPLNVIMGGKDKDGDFTVLEPLMNGKVKYLLLIGDAAEKIDGQISDFVNKTFCSTLQQAVRLGFDLCEKNGTVLLAPGCASFDMFDNFEHRGRAFKEIVRELANG